MEIFLKKVSSLKSQSPSLRTSSGKGPDVRSCPFSRAVMNEMEKGQEYICLYVYVWG